MSDSLDIDSDFKKARAFLVTYSTLALLLWYFSADLASVSILGNTIKLRENTNNAWLVAALANLYFLFRFIQKLPSESLQPDTAMRLTVDNTLINLARRWYKKEIISYAENRLRKRPEAQDNTPPGKLLDVTVRCNMQYWDQFEEEKKQTTGIMKHYKLIHDRRLVVFSVSYSFSMEDGSRGHSSSSNFEVSANWFLMLWSRIYGLIKGSLLTPWFTEYVLPPLYSLLAIAASLTTWWGINHILIAC